MRDQLALLDSAPRAPRLDRRTREAGRRGVAEAREILRRAGPATVASDPGHPDDRAA